VKLNEHELQIVSEALEMPPASFVDEQALRLIAKYDLKLLALTRGEKGTVLYSATQRVEGKVPSYPRELTADNVGAGDSSCAAIIVGMLLDKPLLEIVNLANRVGAYVAAQPGATPILPGEILAQV
jgi:fructokinase